MQGMNVSFLDMSHSKSNEYEGTNVILCGKNSQGGMRVIVHAHLFCDFLWVQG